MRRALLLTLLAFVIAGCGGGTPERRPAPARASACADHLPLDTHLDVPGGARQPRPLILALHGARQGGYGMQRYTGLSDDARDAQRRRAARRAAGAAGPPQTPLDG